MEDNAENIKMLNEKLGITSRENLFNSSGISKINDLFESSKRDFELLCQDIASAKEEVAEAEESATESFDTFKTIAKQSNPETKLAAMETTALAVSNFTDTLQSMKLLVDRGNDIIGKLYDAIVQTDIIDPDLVNASATVIHSIRETNDNLIQFNIEKMKLEQQYKLAIESEQLKQKHKLELEYFKYKLRQQELENKARMKREEEERNNKSEKVDATITDNSSTGRTWNQSDMAEFIRNSTLNNS